MPVRQVKQLNRKARPLRAVLLTSYCDKDNCQDELPCEDCLKRCSVIEITGTFEMVSVGGYDYLRRMEGE